MVEEELSEAEKEAIDEELERLEDEREKRWAEIASARNWTKVSPDLSVFRLSGSKLKSNPRATTEYARLVLDGVGFGEQVAAMHSHLSPEDVALCREVRFLGRGDPQDYCARGSSRCDLYRPSSV